jgi:hypothetical protein
MGSFLFRPKTVPQHTPEQQEALRKRKIKDAIMEGIPVGEIGDENPLRLAHLLMSWVTVEKKIEAEQGELLRAWGELEEEEAAILELECPEGQPYPDLAEAQKKAEFTVSLEYLRELKERGAWPPEEIREQVEELMAQADEEFKAKQEYHVLRERYESS